MIARGELVINGRWYSGSGLPKAKNLCTITVGTRRFRTWNWDLWVSTEELVGKRVEVTYTNKKGNDIFTKITVID